MSLNSSSSSPSSPEKKKKSGYGCHPWWIFGMFMVILGAVFDFLALGFAPQSVVAPLVTKKNFFFFFEGRKRFSFEILKIF